MISWCQTSTKLCKKGGRYQESFQDTTQESDKNKIKHHIQESQEVSLFPAGDHMATLYRQKSMTNTKRK